MSLLKISYYLDLFLDFVDLDVQLITILYCLDYCSFIVDLNQRM